MPSRRRFLTSGTLAALAASLLPIPEESPTRTNDRMNDGRETEGGGDPDPGSAYGDAVRAADAARALRRARSRAARGQSVPTPER